MGDLSPRRWTALEFEHAGVDFVLSGGADARVVGPIGRPDLMIALRGAVAWRLEVMRSCPRGSAPVITPKPPTCRTGACCCCGDAMRAYRGGHCALCILAIDRLRREVRS
jgi:hypothetical protein